MKTCRFCAEEVPEDVEICPYCEQDISSDNSQEQMKRCKFCAEWVRKDATICKFCESAIGEPQEKTPASAAGDFRCEQCGSVVDPSIVICPSCKKFTGTSAYDTRAGTTKARTRQKERDKSNPWPLIGILVVIALIIGYALGDRPTSSISQSPTSTAKNPTATRRPTAGPTEPPQTLGDTGCVYWSKVTHRDVDKILCVYGIIVETEHAGQSWFAFFSRNTDSTSSDFRLYAIDAFYTNVGAGDCISLEGKVRSYGDSSFVFINPTSPTVGGDVFIWDDRSVCNP